MLYKVPENCYKNVTLATEQTSYRSHPGYNISDHKPVTSEFTIKVSSFLCFRIGIGSVHIILHDIYRFALRFLLLVNYFIDFAISGVVMGGWID